MRINQINCYSTPKSKMNTNQKNVSFGTTLYISRVVPENYTKGLCHADFFHRPQESNPLAMADFLLETAAKNPQKNIEMKIWGCSDLSNFLTKMIAMKKLTNDDPILKEKFNNIELVDIDPQIIKRAQSGRIGVNEFEFRELQRDFRLDARKYFTPDTSKKPFFIDGEPRSMIHALGEVDYIDSEMVKALEIKPYNYSPELLNGAKIRVGDIRQDVEALPAPKSSTLRIFEFANGWECMPHEEQKKLAENIAKKLQKNDVFIIGHVDLFIGVNNILKKLGFSQHRTLREVFIKTENTPLLKNLMKLIKP